MSMTRYSQQHWSTQHQDDQHKPRAAFQWTLKQDEEIIKIFTTLIDLHFSCDASVPANDSNPQNLVLRSVTLENVIPEFANLCLNPIKMMLVVQVSQKLLRVGLRRG